MVTRLESSQSRGLYTAKTVSLSASALAAERDRLMAAPDSDWGTIDPSPVRSAGPGKSGDLFDWGVVLALVTFIGGVTVTAGATLLAAGVVIFIQADPMMAQGHVANQVTPVLEIPPTQPIVIQAAPAQIAAAAPAAKPQRPAKRTRARARSAAPAPKAQAARSPAPTVPRDGEAAMSLSQLRSYLGDGSAEPAAAPAPAPYVAPRPAPAPYVAPAPAPYVAPAPAPYVAPAPAPAPYVAPPAARSNSGVKQLSTRLGKAPNGVLILDDPFDPVPVGISTDYGAAIYVDGELLGGAPLAVVVDRGSHEVTVQAENGTSVFTLDASEGDKWCFSVKREPKIGSCK